MWGRWEEEEVEKKFAQMVSAIFSETMEAYSNDHEFFFVFFEFI